MCILRMCTLLGIAKLGSQTPPLSLQTRCTFPRDPPEPSQSQLLSTQGPPRTPLGAPKGAKGPLKSVRTTIKKRRKYMYLASRICQKRFFMIFGAFLEALGRTLVRTHTAPTLPIHGAQKRPRAIPGTSLGEPWALQSTLVNFNLAIVLFKIGDCELLHIFTTFFTILQ